MLSNVSQLLSQKDVNSFMQHITLPTQTAKMAVAVLAILPLVILYPFALKYFVKGINVGGVKG